MLNLQFSALYQQGQKGVFFSWKRIIGWMVNGMLTSSDIRPKHLQSFYLGIQKRRTGSRHCAFRTFHIHQHRVDSQLPDSSNDHAFYLDPTFLDLGKHPELVHLLALLWRTSSRVLKQRIQTPYRGCGTRTLVLARCIISRSYISPSILYIHCNTLNFKGKKIFSLI